MLGRGKGAQAQPLIRRNLCVPARFRAVLRRHGLVPGRSVFSNYLLMPFDRFQGLNEKLAPMLEGLASVPLVRRAGSVYIISAQRMNAASDL
jgi:DNA-binding transcriptional regulator/RsmH inhibitor MraZ